MPSPFAVDPPVISRRPSMHGATLLALWLMWLLAGQGVTAWRDDVWLALSLGGALLAAPAHLWRLLRRLRWLFGAVLITFAFGTPGRLLVPDLLAGPTVEGLIAALHAAIRLAAMAACVALLFRLLPLRALAGALHRLLHPSDAAPPGPGSLALRLLLVLRDLEHTPAFADWRDWLASDGKADDTITVDVCPALGRADLLALAAGAGALAVWSFA